MTHPSDNSEAVERRPSRPAQRFTAHLLAAIAGMTAVAAGIAVTELIAGAIRGAPSLLTEIGDLIIARQPPGAKDLFVSLFGLNDKLALNLMVLIGALVVGAIGGLLARRHRSLGAGLFVALGLFGLVAALQDPLGSTSLAILNVGLGLLVSLIVLTRLTAMAGRSTWAGDADPATDPTIGSMPDWARRRFLIASAGTLVGAVVVGRYGRALLDAQHPSGVVSTSKLPRALDAVPALTSDQSLSVPGITPLVVDNGEFYRIDTALFVPRVDAQTWRLEVNGMVDRPLTFSYDDLLAMPLFEQYVTLSCVSNWVGGPLVGNALWTGVRLKDVLRMAGVQRGATQLIGRSVDGFTAGFPTAWATDPDREAMIAVGMNREPLPADHGFPARLVVPGLYGYVSATKWLSAIELTTREQIDGYWVPLGWAKDAPILTQSRIDTPHDGAMLTAGETTIAGIAWAPDRGIRRVEVRVDDGEWREAILARPISDATWVQWMLPWEIASGRHPIEVRATDDTGEIQTSDHSPPAPDGARGHHRIFVNAA